MLSPIDIAVELIRTSSFLRTLVIWAGIIAGIGVIGFDNIVTTLGIQNYVLQLSQFIQSNIDLNGLSNEIKKFFNK